MKEYVLKHIMLNLLIICIFHLIAIFYYHNEISETLKHYFSLNEMRNHMIIFFGWLVVFNVPSTARSFRDGAAIYCPISKDVKLGFNTVPDGNRTPLRGSPLHNRCATPAPR